jgi:hypothetical protein
LCFETQTHDNILYIFSCFLFIMHRLNPDSSSLLDIITCVCFSCSNKAIYKPGIDICKLFCLPSSQDSSLWNVKFQTL